MPNSPNMNLPIPVVGTTPGPDWASLLVSSLNLIDAHDHTTGNGVPIPAGAININADLSMNGNNLTSIRSTRFTAQGSPLSGGTDLGCLYVSGVDLYYNDGSGNHVRITQGGGVAGSPGSITNLSSPASASYVAASGKFVWQQAASTSADMDFGSWIARNDTASSFALTVQPPTLSGNQTITLPLAPTGATKIMAMSTAGVITAPYTVDGSTIAISANIIGVPNGGIGTSQLASGAVTAANIAAGTITNNEIASTTILASNIANSTITGTQIASNVNLAGSTVQAGSLNVVTSSTNASTGLKIIRATFHTVGYPSSPDIGEGCTLSRTGTGAYTISWSSTFASAPVVVATIWNSGSNIITVTSAGTSNCTIVTSNLSGGATDAFFSLIAIGPR